MSLERRNAKPPSTGGIFGGGGTSSPIFGTLHRGFTNVLRELEQKKPQLDELVRTADSLRDSPIKQQIPAKDVWLVECPVSQFYHLRVCLKGEMNEFKSELTKTVKDKLSY
ncbi:uncharacterized protein LOC111703894 [Eurytemora carolleeae]|uniref:uncharacterized protein LOC111703894 n=1 Tax=Eurytemora carolleeae TaxID=1294199 RepID=UPI000C78733B|nr:uncharacterized protein LOC111703894 [Eurytemora carolleeae]|eukprot:XP_023331747.1 uncharacterized protein LOC111703894 [Eurytemora affinis]